MTALARSIVRTFGEHSSVCLICKILQRTTVLHSTKACPVTKRVCFGCGVSHPGNVECPAKRVRMNQCCFLCGLPSVVLGVQLHPEGTFGKTEQCPYLGMATGIMMAWQAGMIQTRYQGRDAGQARRELFNEKDSAGLCKGVKAFMTLATQPTQQRK